jgi:hypothetical protein
LRTGQQAHTADNRQKISQGIHNNSNKSVTTLTNCART